MQAGGIHMRALLTILPLIPWLPGCFLPLGTAAPQSATTVGDNGFGASYYAQAPTIDLFGLDEETLPDQEDEPDGLGSAHLGVQLGMNERLDLELQVDAAALLLLLPAPLGGSIGFRHRLYDGHWLDVATAGRAGFLTVDPEGEEGRVNALYGSASVTAQLARGVVRPLLAMSLTPAGILSSNTDGSLDTAAGAAWGATGGVTLVFGRVQVTPYVALTEFDSTETDRTQSMSFGFSVAIRYTSDELTAMFPQPPLPPEPPTGPPGSQGPGS